MNINSNSTSTFYIFETNINHAYFQDETPGQLITSFVGLRAKSYSLTMVDGDGNTSRKLAAAGVKSCIAKKHFSHQDYVDCVHQVEGK